MTARATRRGLLALAPAAALAPASVADTTQHSDAQLLAACARFRALTAEHAGFFVAIPDEAERDEAIDGMHAQWEAALADMCEVRATTLAGAVARALALAEYAPHQLDPEGDYWDSRQAAALLRDLVAMARATGLEPMAKPSTI